jgi:hypothetical protein
MKNGRKGEFTDQGLFVKKNENNLNLNFDKSLKLKLKNEKNEKYNANMKLFTEYRTAIAPQDLTPWYIQKQIFLYFSLYYLNMYVDVYMDI